MPAPRAMPICGDNYCSIPGVEVRSIRNFALCLLLLGLGLAPAALAAAKPDPDVERLQASLAVLDGDPALADLAGLERLRARQALTALQAARSRDRPQALFLAEHRVEIAQDAAQAELLEHQADQLDRERDAILLEASRRDADQARQEAERLRVQTLAREEEAERLTVSAEADRQAREQSDATAVAATAEAAQARKLAQAREHEASLARKEADLAAAVAADSLSDSTALPPMRRDGARQIYTLAGTAFATGRASLTTEALAGLRRLAGSLNGNSRRISIVGYTDSQGADAANLALSRQRAEAVRQALVAAGVASGRLSAVGKGEASPVADNASADGRARNRRVEIVLN